MSAFFSSSMSFISNHSQVFLLFDARVRFPLGRSHRGSFRVQPHQRASTPCPLGGPGHSRLAGNVGLGAMLHFPSCAQSTYMVLHGGREWKVGAGSGRWGPGPGRLDALRVLVISGAASDYPA